MAKAGPEFVALDNPGKRMTVFLRWFSLFLIACVVQLLHYQVFSASDLAKEAMNKRLETNVQSALRGSITDKSGSPIATTLLARNVTVDQTLVVDPHGTAKKIAHVLGVSASSLEPSLTGKKRFAYVARNIPPDTWTQILSLNLPGLSSERTTTRYYPAKSLAANIVGFVGQDGHGLGGLESSLDKQLSGIDGERQIEWVNGHEIPTSERQNVDPINGLGVRLTIDKDLQALAERALADEVKKAGASGGDVLVMDPTTGNLLAMASSPTWDPNLPMKKNEQRRNPATADAFEPGSTSKIMTIAAVIEERAATPLTKMTIPPTLKRADVTFHDHDPHPELHLTLNGVLAQSSNIGTILAAEKIGQDAFLKYLDRFGVGHKTGLNFPGESSGKLPTPDSSEWSGTSFPTLAFGQGLSVTALQATSVFATIANDGVRMTPRLIDAYLDPDGSVVPTAPSDATRVVSATTAKTVREMLESVVGKDGTAPAAQIPGYRVAGKTGTANKYNEKLGRYSGYTASFIGFAPAEAPRLVVAVMIQDPVNGHYGATVAAPVFRQVMMYALSQQRVPPSTTKPPKLAVTW